MMQSLISKIRQFKQASVQKRIALTVQEYNALAQSSVMINLRRIFYASMIAMPIQLTHITLFYFRTPQSAVEALWRKGILYSNCVLFACVLACCLLANVLRKQEKPGPCAYLLQYAAITLLLAAGVSIVCIDQLVTSSITPFLVSCTIVGVVFLLRPAASFPLFLSTFAVFYASMGWSPQPPEILLSNRVNGLTAVGIALAVSLIIWENYRISAEQRRLIERQKEELEKAAYYDPLTGLSNRRYFDDLVRKKMAEQTGRDSSIIVLDIDDFKQINDTYGHPCGDSVLKELAQLLQEQMRGGDTVSRFGGEEFVILLNDTPIKEGVEIAERLRRAIEDKTFEVDGETTRITASFGIAPLCDIEYRGYFHAYTSADKALYLAKLLGKNRVEAAS